MNVNDLFQHAHRGPYRPDQQCLVIHSPVRQILGQVLTIASWSAWHVTDDGPIRWEPDELRICRGLEVQHIYARGRGVATFPVRWLVPIGEDPDLIVVEARARSDCRTIVGQR